jgi:hypothetical protein
MSSFSAVSIPKPKDWQDFERKSRVLFECVLGDPQTHTHGRGGQKQDGVDIYGRRDSGRGQLVGLQCKGKDGQYGRQITEKELLREVEKARTFEPPLDEFILITTAPDDRDIQKKARLLEHKVRQAGRALRIAVWGWNTLEQRIAEHHRAIKAFHPDFTPVSDQVVKHIEHSRHTHARQTKKLDQLLSLVEQLSAVSFERRQLDIRADEFTPLLDIITPVAKLETITSEKGTGHGTTKAWPRGSLFEFIDSGMRLGRTNSSFERFPNLVCDDGPFECADFIGWDSGERRVVFVHTKCSRPVTQLSVSALHGACAQLVRNIVFLRNSLSFMPEWGRSWRHPWQGGRHVVQSRIRAGANPNYSRELAIGDAST